MATFEDFQKSDIRVGRIIDVQDFPEARKPTFKLKLILEMILASKGHVHS